MVVDAIVDIGRAKTLADLESAQAMGLPVQMPKGSEFGTFYGPGSVEQAYAGIVAVPVPAHFLADVVLYIHELKVIAHPEPLLLLGVDLLCLGHPGWTSRVSGLGAIAVVS